MIIEDHSLMFLFNSKSCRLYTRELLHSGRKKKKFIPPNNVLLSAIKSNKIRHPIIIYIKNHIRQLIVPLDSLAS